MSWVAVDRDGRRPESAALPRETLAASLVENEITSKLLTSTFQARPVCPGVQHPSTLFSAGLPPPQPTCPENKRPPRLRQARTAPHSFLCPLPPPSGAVPHLEVCVSSFTADSSTPCSRHRQAPFLFWFLYLRGLGEPLRGTQSISRGSPCIWDSASPDQQHRHHLGTIRNTSSWALSSENSGDGRQPSSFSRSLMLTKFEKCWCRK